MRNMSDKLNGRQDALAFYLQVISDSPVPVGVFKDIVAQEEDLTTKSSVKDNGDGTATMRIFGPIDSWFGFDTKAAIQDLDDIEDLKELEVVITSPGGHLFDALGLYGEIVGLREKGVTVNTVGRGLLASAATLIFAAGEKRILNTATSVMVHKPRTGLIAFGNEDVLLDAVEDTVTMLREGAATMKAAYIDGGVSEEDAESFISTEKDMWIKPADAVEMNLATAEAKAPKKKKASAKLTAALAIIEGRKAAERDNFERAQAIIAATNAAA